MIGIIFKVRGQLTLRVVYKLTHGWLNSLMSFHSENTPALTSNTGGNGEFTDRADGTAINPYADASHKIVNGLVLWLDPAFVNTPQRQYGSGRISIPDTVT